MTNNRSIAENVPSVSETTTIGPEEIMMPMRDEVRLHTRIWMPGTGVSPVVLTWAYRPGFGDDH